MPKQVEIKVFQIAKTKVDRAAVRQWLNHLKVEGDVFLDGADASDPALLIALAAKRCYMAFEPGLNPNLTSVRSDMVDYIDNILRSGHGSVLEHASFCFAIEGVSRVFTAEMNRHRAGWAISEGSLRFIRFDQSIPFWMPTSLRFDPSDDADLRSRKERSQQVFLTAFANQENLYKELVHIWDMDTSDKNFTYKKKVTSCMRRIVGMGVATGGVWTGNIRALRHVLASRAAPEAEEEIFHVFGTLIGPKMIETESALFGDFKEIAAVPGSLTPKYRKV